MDGRYPRPPVTTLRREWNVRTVVHGTRVTRGSRSTVHHLNVVAKAVRTPLPFPEPSDVTPARPEVPPGPAEGTGDPTGRR